MALIRRESPCQKGFSISQETLLKIRPRFDQAVTPYSAPSMFYDIIRPMRQSVLKSAKTCVMGFELSRAGQWRDIRVSIGLI